MLQKFVSCTFYYIKKTDTAFRPSRGFNILVE